MTPTRKQRKYRQNLLVQSGLTRQETKGLKTWDDFVLAYDKAIERALENTNELPHRLMEDIVRQMGPAQMGLSNIPGTITHADEHGIYVALDKPATYVKASFKIEKDGGITFIDSEKQNGG